MAAMLQQQYVVQETEPRDWAACGESGGVFSYNFEFFLIFTSVDITVYQYG